MTLQPAISGSFIHKDGTIHHFRLTEDGAVQWGADTEHHGATVDLLGALHAAADEDGFLTPDRITEPAAPGWVPRYDVGDVLTGTRQELGNTLEYLPEEAIIQDGRGIIWVRGRMVSGIGRVWRGTNGHTWTTADLIDSRIRNGHDMFTVKYLPGVVSYTAAFPATTHP